MRFKLFVENLGVFVDEMINSKGHYDRAIRLIGSDWFEDNGMEGVATMLRAAASGDKTTFHHYMNLFVEQLRAKKIYVDLNRLEINTAIRQKGWITDTDVHYVLRPNGLFRIGDKSMTKIPPQSLSDDMNLSVLILVATKMNTAGGRVTDEHLHDITLILRQLHSYRTKIDQGPHHVLSVPANDIAKTLDGLANALSNGIPADRRTQILDTVQYFSNFDGGIIDRAASKVLAMLR